VRYQTCCHFRRYEH